MKTEYTKLTITLPKDLKEKFKQFCEGNGINASGRIAILIREDLRNKSLKSKNGTSNK